MHAEPGRSGTGWRRHRWLLMLLLLAGCRGAETPVSTTQFVAFDSAVDLSIVGAAKETAQQAAAETEADFVFLDRELSTRTPGPMQRTNERLATGEPFAAPPSLLPLLRQSQVLALQSDNLFNPAIGRLLGLWGFHVDPPECRPPPERAAIERLVGATPTMADIYIDGILLQSDNAAVQLDFDNIAAAYAMDIAIANLRARGIRNAMINAGGNVRVIGNRSGRPWRVPVRRANGAGVMAILNLSGDASLFTSSDYRRNFVYEGTTYHSVIDPRSGWPAAGFKAVTVLHHGDAATASAAATALLIAGPERWHEIATRMGIRYALMVDDAGTVYMDPDMAARIELIDRNLEVVIGPSLAEEAPGR